MFLTSNHITYVLTFLDKLSRNSNSLLEVLIYIYIRTLVLVIYINYLQYSCALLMDQNPEPSNCDTLISAAVC